MTLAQGEILGILAVAIILFVWGRWRHDMVAMGALLAAVALGLVPADDAFRGFGHPAVITVAAVLVLSSGLQSSGAVEAVAGRILPATQDGDARRAWLSVMALAGLAALLSAVMNNVGALALLMPLALRLARRSGLPSGRVLMPLAFASILGGMTTLVGTPPNLIVSGFRAAEQGQGFVMFDFTPVGLAVALAGLVFIGVFARFLVPERRGSGSGSFETAAYLTEARVGPDSAAAGLTLAEVEQKLDAADAQVVGLVRREVRIAVPARWRRIETGDILVIETDSEALAAALSSLGLTLEEDVAPPADRGKEDAPAAGSGTSKEPEEAPAPGQEVALAEVAILPQAEIVGRSASDLQIRSRYGVNLLAVSRQGQRSVARLRSMRLEAGACCCCRARRRTSRPSPPNGAACRWPSGRSSSPTAGAPSSPPPSWGRRWWPGRRGW